MQTRRTDDASPLTTWPRGGDPGRLPRLRNWRVRSKLIAVLVIPAVAFVGLASFGIGASVQNVRALDRGTSLAEFGREVTALVHELQSERDLGAGYMEVRSQDPTSKTKRERTRDEELIRAFTAQQPLVDQRMTTYREAEAPLYDTIGARQKARLDAARAGLEDLAGLREAAASGSLTEQGIFNEYSQLITDLLDVDLEIAQPGGNEELAQSVRAFNDLSAIKEVTSRVRGTLHAIAYRGAFAFGEFQDLADLLAKQQAATQQFRADASEQQRTLFDDVVTGQAVLAVNRMARTALSNSSAQRLDVPPEQWLAASSTQVELMRSVESQLLDSMIDQSQDLSSTARGDALRDALLIAAILAVALLALFVIARSMARPLQHLRAGAREIAERRLPEAVQRLRTTESGDLDVAVEPIGIRSRDEIGQVAQAVDEIQEVAVRLATEQAALRRSIGDMFTNLARRSQTLIDRQLELIDDLERNEANPETLEHLFRLDHLATRMRRNAEDLIVLSGADPGRHWVQRMTLVDVVRAAAAEVEEYQRVEFLPLADLEVTGHASVDVIHLLAELIENATVFSPPNTKVQVAGQAVPHGYVVEIEDRGLGMSDEELIQANERLANPPEIDFALSRVLGLYVVGRLAQRHGIKVQLRHSWYGGVTALALVPHALLAWPKEPAAMPEPVDVIPNRAELPSPDRVAQPVAAPGDHLPIFEAARSDWFAPESAEPPLPIRQRAAAGDGTSPRLGPTPRTEAPGPYRPAHARADDQPLPSRRPPAAGAPDPRLYPPEPSTTQAPAPPVHQPEPARTDAEPAYQSEPAAPAAGQAPAQPATAEHTRQPDGATTGPRLTQAGLPRRVPRANLAPGMVASQEATAGQPESVPASGRSPEEVRSMLSSYRTGLERGRTVAGGADIGERPQDAP